MSAGTEDLATVHAQAHRTASPTTIRRAGIVGIAAGLLFLVLLIWEYSAGIQPDVVTKPYPIGFILNQVGFTIALAGYAVAAHGLLRSGAIGSGRFARIAGWGFVLAFVFLVVGNVLTFVGLDPNANPLFPLGGILQTLAGLAVGILVARAGVWRGWQRWWPLALAIYWIVGMFGPLFADIEPTFPREAIWALSYAVLGLALVTSRSSWGSVTHRD